MTSFHRYRNSPGRILVATVLSLLAGTAYCSPPESAIARPNILFIVVDDLRPELGAYNRRHMHTPNIDRLAQQGLVFERAYAMVPTCGASRASVMTGLRPSRSRFVDFKTRADVDAPEAVTINTYFKNAGYTTGSLGKVFQHKMDNSSGWSNPAWRPSASTYQGFTASELKQIRTEYNSSSGPPFEALEVEDDVYADGKIADKSVSTLRKLAKQDKPFFLAVGFMKPHLPFVAPKKYWDLYQRDSVQLPQTYAMGDTAAKDFFPGWRELRGYAGIPKEGQVSDKVAHQLVQGYRASVSYVDAQIGRVLDEVNSLELWNNTIVLLWGDHGWNLGEHGVWCKHSCFESSLHSPLIVSAPGFASGTRISALVEFIDIYPTLVELAGLPMSPKLDGASLAPLMRNPGSPWKNEAYSRYRGCDSIRTDRYRLSTYSSKQGHIQQTMLYDHMEDPGETTDLSARPEYASIVTDLQNRLRALTDLR